MTTLTPEGILTYELLTKAGVDVAQAVRPVFVNQVISGLLLAVICFVYYKGWRVTVPEEAEDGEQESFSKKQLLSLSGLVVMSILVVLLSSISVWSPLPWRRSFLCSIALAKVRALKACPGAFLSWFPASVPL